MATEGTRCACEKCLLLHAVTEATERAEKAEAEAERLLSELASIHPRALAAEATIDRVRALCDDRAAIDGEDR